MDIKEIIDDVQNDGEEQKANDDAVVSPESRKQKKKISKKVLLLFPIIIFVAIAGFLFLKKKNTGVLTGPGAPAVFSSKFLQKPQAATNPVSVKMQKPVSMKQSGQKTKPASLGNKLNDMFTIKYKHKPAKTNLPNGPVYPGIPQNAYIPPAPQSQNLPHFNIKNLAGKLKNTNINRQKNSFTVSGYSGGYVVVECGKNENYLKTGDSSCGYVLLKAGPDGAVFSVNGKIKKIAY